MRRITLLLVLVFSLLAVGCGTKTGKIAKGDISLDKERAQTITVTGSEGAGFEIQSGDTKASIIVLPGTFPSGTDITVTPLSKDDGLMGKGLSAAFSITAKGGDTLIQPSMPVFATFETSKELPDSVCLVAYNDGENKGRAIKSRIVKENGSNYVIAELNHLTIFRIGDRDDGYVIVPPPEPKGEWKEWRFVVNGPPKKFYMEDNEVWDFEAAIDMTAVNKGGSIGGTYTGQLDYTISGVVKEGAIAGPAAAYLKLFGNLEGKSSGPVEFTLMPKPWKNDNINTVLKPGDPKVDVGEWLDGEGSVKLSGTASLDIGATGPNVSGRYTDQDAPAKEETYRINVLVSPRGITMQILGIGVWEGALVGVPN